MGLINFANCFFGKPQILTETSYTEAQSLIRKIGVVPSPNLMSSSGDMLLTYLVVTQKKTTAEWWVTSSFPFCSILPFNRKSRWQFVGNQVCNWMPFAATQPVVPLKVHNGCGVLVATERLAGDRQVAWGLKGLCTEFCFGGICIFVNYRASNSGGNWEYRAPKTLGYSHCIA